jgi:hypothetical protein
MFLSPACLHWPHIDVGRISIIFRGILSVVLFAVCSGIYINEEANDVVQAILKHFDENPQDSRFEQVIFIPSDKCHLFPKVWATSSEVELLQYVRPV